MKTIQTGIPELDNVMCELYTLTLQDGSVYFFNTGDIDLIYRGNRYRSDAVQVSRSAITTNVGVEVSTVDVTLTGHANFKGLITPIFARNGGFDNAHLIIERARADRVIHLFQGNVTDIGVGRYHVNLTISSDLELLNIQMPHNLYEANCIHTLFDAGCGLQKADFLINGSILTGSISNLLLTDLTQADDYFSLGTVEFTDGVNQGAFHTIKTQQAGQLALSFPLENQPQVNDNFKACPGCNGSKTACESKFNNLANFRAFPYVPPPSASV